MLVGVEFADLEDGSRDFDFDFPVDLSEGAGRPCWGEYSDIHCRCGPAAPAGDGPGVACGWAKNICWSCMGFPMYQGQAGIVLCMDGSPFIWL